MEYKLSPSILSADFCNLEEGIRQTEENGAVYLHFDVMDGVSYRVFLLECLCLHQSNRR